MFVTETTQIGGAEINLLMIAPRLQSQGWRVAVALPGPGPLAERLQEQGIPMHFVPRGVFVSASYLIGGRYKIPNPLSLLFNIPVCLAWLLRLYLCFRRLRPTIVHTTSMWAHALAGLAARMVSCRVVWHFQDIVSPRSGFGLYPLLIRFWAKNVPHRILSVSGRVAELFHSLEGRDRRFIVLENAVDVGRFSPPVAQRTRAQGKPLRCGTVARLTPWKGQESALRAAHILQQQGVSFSWSFAGDVALGDKRYEKHLRDLVEKWELNEEVSFVGWVPDIASFYHKLDLLVHVPVEPEPFGLTLAEALAAGLPVITTYGGGAQHIVAEAGGILVPPNQPETLAQVLRNLAENPEERMQRGYCARAYATENLDVEPYIQRLACIYGNVIGENT